MSKKKVRDTGPGIVVHCSYRELLPIEDLKKQFHPKNRNMHPKRQIERLAEIIRGTGIRRAATISNRSGFITVGHGRILSAEKAGATHYPVDFQDYASEEQELADVTADNAIALWAELDLPQIRLDVQSFPLDFNRNLFGLRGGKLDLVAPGQGLYTGKIQSPIYEPKGEKPSEAELYDLTKWKRLEEEILGAGLPTEVEQFLRFAATRHIVFNYEKIAEYYAHAPAEIQGLMEKSALVIIDFQKAVEQGFVELTKTLSGLYQKEGDESD